jgi:hypothetical protein
LIFKAIFTCRIRRLPAFQALPGESGVYTESMLPHWIRPLLIAAGVAALSAGCVAPPERSAPFVTHARASGTAGVCARLFASLDAAIDAAGVRDAETRRILGFPYLRVDRFWSALRHDIAESNREFWAGQLRRLDLDARRYEIANLPAQTDFHAWDTASREELLDRIDLCGMELLREDLADPGSWRLLVEHAVVPDSYSSLKRAAGLYPLSAMLVKHGVHRLQDTLRTTFSTPPDALEIKGRLVRYGPPPAAAELEPAAVRHLLAGAAAGNPFGIPLLNKDAADALLDAFAPIWEIDMAGNADRIGVVRLDDAGRAEVDVTRPVVYRRISYTRFEGEYLAQLNYIVWFPERPRVSAWDLLGGHLDGITWRVTLDSGGRPLMYDAMHNCGCYHMFFPAAPLAMRETAGQEPEPILVAGRAPQLAARQRLRIRVASGTHYLQHAGIATLDDAGMRYEWAEYDALRSLPLPVGGYRSLFGEDGLIAGTSRRERWLLWPMGVADPGAMRQWGHHAIAFIGRRHFDDPDLIDRYFYP